MPTRPDVAELGITAAVWVEYRELAAKLFPRGLDARAPHRQRHRTELQMRNPHPDAQQPWQVGDHVDVDQNGSYRSGFVSSIHHLAGDRTEYVVHLADPAGGVGGILNVDAAARRLRPHRRAALRVFGD